MVPVWLVNNCRCISTRITDVTEFRVGGQKLYLSPMLDLYNGETIAFKTARHPLFDIVGAMLRQAFEKSWGYAFRS